MKQTITFFLLIIFSSAPLWSQWQNETLTFDSTPREYRVYVPTNYNPANPASLVLTLHGLGDNMTNFSSIGMNTIAESQNIIVVVPQALTDALTGSTAWNSGAGLAFYIPNEDVDDVGFISALIDKVSVDYSIDPNKVFSCGFSMGGFMTERLAIELNTKIKAFASVAGTFGNGILPVAAGAPGRAVSIAHFHGTSDGTIAYTGNSFGNDVDDMISYWKTNNQSNTTPVHTILPNTANDGYTVDHYKYTSQTNASVIELFKVNGADHVWLGPSNDISYTSEIWKFFNSYIQATLSSVDFEKNPVSIFPNPAVDKINFSFNDRGSDNQMHISVYDSSGREIYNQDATFTNGNYTLPVENLNCNNGVYLIRLKSNSFELNEKVIINNIIFSSCYKLGKAGY